MATRTLINNRAVMNNNSPLASILNLHRLSLDYVEKIPIDVRYQAIPAENASEAEPLLDIFTTNDQYGVLGYAFGDNNLYILLQNTDLNYLEGHLYNSETKTIGEVVPGIVECEAPVKSSNSNSSCSFYIVTDTDNDVRDYIDMYVGCSLDNDSPRIVAQFGDGYDNFDTSETYTPPGGDVVQ